MQAKRRHHWNGRWGRLARHDVIVWEDGDRWLVEDRIGGVEGRATFTECDTEASAAQLASTKLVGDGWRDL